MAGMPAEHVCCESAVSLVNTRSCAHRSCSVQTALLSESVRLDTQLAVVATIPAAAESGQFANLAALILIPVRGPPSLPKASPVSLHTTLLV